jgi:predicted ATPase
LERLLCGEYSPGRGGAGAEIGECAAGGRWFEAELRRHKGRLLLQQGHAEAAEELYCKAVDISREQEAKLWELRAAVSFAQLRRGQGRGGEARNLLAPILRVVHRGL